MIGFFNLTLATCATILIILIVKRLFKGKISGKWQLAIWLVLLLQIITFPLGGLMPESQLSVKDFVPSVTVSEGVSVQPSHEATAISADASTAASDVYTGTVSVNSPFTQHTYSKGVSLNNLWVVLLSEVLKTIWFAGALLLLGVFIASGAHSKRNLSQLPLVRCEETLDIFKECKSSLGISKNIPLRSGAASPMLLGLFNPTIYISNDYTGDELRYVLTHELCHYKNKDVAISILAAVILCAFWFNPLMWLAFYVIRKDIEVYCDERTIAATGERKEYARVLLKTAVNQNSFVFSSTALIQGEKEVEGRIKNMSGISKRKLWVGAFAAALILIVAVACLTNSASSSKTTAVMYPSLIYGSLVFDVPTKWLTNMETVFVEDTVDEQYFEHNEKTFSDKDGNTFAGTFALALGDDRMPCEHKDCDIEMDIKSVLLILSDLTATKRLHPTDNIAFTEPIYLHGTPQEEDIAMIDTIDFPAILKSAISDSKTKPFSGASLDEITVTDMGAATVAEGLYGYKYYTAEAVKDGKSYSFALGIGSTAVGLWAESDEMDAKGLLKQLKTLRFSDDMNDIIGQAGLYLPFEEIKTDSGTLNLTQYRGPFSEVEFELAAKTLLTSFFDKYVSLGLPVECAIKGYEITSISSVTPEDKVPNILDTSVPYPDKCPWDLIYPNLRVYKVDYSLSPADAKYFSDYAGGGFEILEDGTKHYAESYAVIAKNVYLSPELSDGSMYFLGFIHPSNLAEYGLDASVLLKANAWYESLMTDQVRSELHNKFIGIIQETGKIVGSMPMSQHIDTSEGTFMGEEDGSGIVLQTKSEPYGLIVNYTFDQRPISFLMLSSRMALQPDWHPEILLNAYLKQQIKQNMEFLFDTIGNLSVLTVKVWYPTELTEAELLAKGTEYKILDDNTIHACDIFTMTR